MKLKKLRNLKFIFITATILIFANSCQEDSVLDLESADYGQNLSSDILESKSFFINASNENQFLKIDNFEPIDWTKSQISEIDGVRSVEVPVLLRKGLELTSKSNNGNSTNRLLFTKTQDEIEMFLVNISSHDSTLESIRDFDFISHSVVNDRFSGIVLVLNDEMEMVRLDRYSGENINSDDSPILSKDPKVCYGVYELFDDGSRELVYFLGCEGGDGGGESNSGGGPSGTGDPNTDTEDSQNSGIEPEIKDDDLDDCTKSILDELLQTVMMQSILDPFINGNSVVTISTNPESTFENTTNFAETDFDEANGEGYSTIMIGSNYQSSATTLGLARIVIHEAIHARLLAYVDAIRANPDDMDIVAEAYNNAPDLFNNMNSGKHGDPNTNLEKYMHDEMAENYVDDIAQILQAHDNYRNTQTYYMELAWGGLTNTDAFRAQSVYSAFDVYTTNSAEDTDNSNAKGEKCLDGPPEKPEIIR